MIVRRRPTSVVAMTVLTAGLVSLGAQAPIAVTDAWVREPVPGRPMTAAYAVIENPGANEIALVGVSSEVAGTLELHEMVRTGDMMKMQQVKQIVVPASGKVELKPGGYHVMLFDLKQPLKVGDEVTLTFTTSSGWRIKVPAKVKKGTM